MKGDERRGMRGGEMRGREMRGGEMRGGGRWTLHGVLAGRLLQFM